VSVLPELHRSLSTLFTELVEGPPGIAGVAHWAYHLGAIRQIDRSIRGPGAEGVLT
jgi:hypothetical protein